MCMTANIALAKTDCRAVRHFLHKHVSNGGAMPVLLHAIPAL